jgi:hypothetical protein
MVGYMAFIGTPVLELVTPNLVRITGVSLAANASGTIGFADASGSPLPEVVLPRGFRVPSGQGHLVALTDGIRVTVTPVSAGPFTNLPPSIVKAGTTPEDFTIGITNTKVDETTQTLEIYIESVSSAKSPTVNIIGPTGDIQGPLIVGDERIG